MTSAIRSPQALQGARIGLLATSVTLAVITAGLLSRAAWATSAWPWPDAKMSYIFGASITATIAVVLLWIGWSGDVAALEPFALELGCAFPAMAAYLAWLALDQDDADLWPHVSLYVLGAAAAWMLWWWCRGIPLQDRGPLPSFLRWSFRAFVAVLVPVGLLLVFQRPRIFPWDLLPETSTLIGIVFLGAATLFAWIVVHPRWSYGLPALLGFLAYDLVLLIPYLGLLRDWGDEEKLATLYATESGGAGELNEVSLIFYLVVITVSGGIAIYALFIDHRTRIIGNARDAGTAGV